MEAFAKFGSDLDKATQLIIDRGRRNQEILKQPQYAPVPVELQIAVIYASTRGFIDNIPLEKVKDFERDYIQELQNLHKDVLQTLKSGAFTEKEEEILKKTATEVASKFI
jgi:F-type H+-transporting ATPase subunit alpha